MVRGDVVADRFEIDRLVGAGGMGSVYRATDLHTGEIVAVKIQTGRGEAQRRRWAAEANLLAKLSGPGIVRYVAHGETVAGHLYLAMEWLEGEDLAARLDREGLTIAESISVVRQVAAALQQVHEQAIAHRDIKPSNIFLVDRSVERVRLIDFGIAHVGGATRSRTHVGTPGYVAPEQARGDRTIDGRADVFALGCVLYECLTGRPAFVADHVIALLGKILLEDAPRPSLACAEIPPQLDDLVSRMLSREVEGRPAHGAAVIAELDALAVGASRSAPPRETRVLTEHEQRLAFVVLATATGEVLTADPARRTLAEDSEVTPDLRALARAYGAEATPLADGSTVLLLESGGSANDQAIHAARCALALHAMLPHGAVSLAVGRSGTGGRLPIGEVVDRATALLRQPRSARTSSVLIDDAIVGLVDARFELGTSGHGLTLEHEKRRFELPRTLLGKPTPCVGREAELATLETFVADCLDSRVPRALLVTAPAGTGKSRLIHELLARIAARPGAPEIWMGRGDPMRAGSPFGLIAQVIRGAAECQGNEPIEVRWARLSARVARHVPAPDRERISEFLGELAGTPFVDRKSVQLRAARADAALMRDQLSRTWREWFAAEATAGPILIVLEDLHWGDLPSLLLVDTALRSVRDRPWAVIAVGRPGVHEVFPRLWADRRLRELHLDELPQRASEELVRAVLPDAPTDAVERIATRSTGIPFYLEELIRAEASGRGERIPDTVIAMLQARLERLSPETRRVLRAASVFGSTFERDGVARLCGIGIQLREALDRLEQHELIERRGDTEYVFRHEIVRETAYASLTGSDRVLGHQLAARWLEEIGERDAMTLAEHYERGGDAATAIGWYRRAAEQALDGADFAGAIERSERGIACGAAGESLGVLRLVQSEALLWRGELVSSEREAALAMYELPPGSARWFKAALGLLMQSASLGREEQIGQFIRQLIASPTQQRSAAQTMAFALAHRLLVMTGARPLARVFFDRLAEIDRAVEREPEISAMVPGGQFYWWTYVDWDPYARLQACERCAREFELVGDAMNLAMARIHIGWARIGLGAWQEAEHVLRDTLALAKTNGVSGLVPDFALVHLGEALAGVGLFGEAAEVEREAIPRLFAANNWIFGALARAELARIALATGDVATALEQACGAAGALTRVPAVRVRALAILSSAQLAAGDTAAAHASAREASALCDGLDIVTEADPLLALAYANALVALGEAPAAAAVIARAAGRLGERAARIPDLAVRRSMLEGIPEHAELVQRAGSSS
jgi:tetratricopeptide (TPR) repeat protein/predicted Ser/Thr protein kinase